MVWCVGALRGNPGRKFFTSQQRLISAMRTANKYVERAWGERREEWKVRGFILHTLNTDALCLLEAEAAAARAQASNINYLPHVFALRFDKN